MKFIFRDWKNKEHTKTTKATSCRYAYEYVNGVQKLVVRDYFNNKIINKFFIPDGWMCIRVDN